jgi:hypothetical protein
LRKFGLEFEFSTDIEIVTRKLKRFLNPDELDITDRYHKSINNKKWHIKTDASTESEIVTPVSTLQDLNKICDLIKFTKRNHFKVTKKDGLHIHIQITGIPLRKLVAGWLCLENTFFALVPKYRRTKEHCQSLWDMCATRYINPRTCRVEDALETALEHAAQHHIAFSTERYDGRTHTVEIRIAEGSNDVIFIKHWILFCLAFIEWCKKQQLKKLLQRDRISIREALNEFDISEETKKTIIKRFKKFGKKT